MRMSEAAAVPDTLLCTQASGLTKVIQTMIAAQAAMTLLAPTGALARCPSP